MQTVTLQANDFSTIHNALCELRNHSRDNAKLQQVVKQFEAGLEDAYAQDEAAFDDKMDYFREYADANDFDSVWSMFELPVGCFDQPHPYPSNALVVYGEGNYVPVLGPTWGDVYRAADCAIRNSDDSHHIFIEGFDVKGRELHMYTGS